MNPSSFFKEINSWQDFVSAIDRLDKKGRGDAFELLTKYFFLLNPRYSFYDNVWLWKDVPEKVLDDIGLPGQDLGIDLIAQSGKEYHAIQCKYHSDKHKAVTYREVSTFLSAIAKCDKISMGYICSSANVTSKNYDKVPKKLISKVLSDTWENLLEEFFRNLRTYIENKAVKLEVYKPLPHQKKAVDQAKSYFLKGSRGKLIFPCGSGKSLTGFWITRELQSKNTLIAVPSLSLVKQTLDVYLGQIVARKEKVKWLCICSDDSIGKSDDVVVLTEDIGVPCVTDPVYIERWLKDNKEHDKIIFTTYQSGKIIAEITNRLKLSFDVGIYDEAHKTVGSDKSLFSHLLFDKNIRVNKRVFMTATERFYAGSKDDITSMDDDDIYGETFAHMSFKEAINDNLLTDYKIITIDIKKSEIAQFIKDNNLVQLSSKWKRETEARSLASMLALRKAMKRINIKNAVSFHSSIEKAIRNKELQKYITETYNYKPIDTYTVSGKIPTTKRNDIVQEFAKSPKALITNARCLTEGVDVPNIDCIVFADPRKSKVDIVQALGRALRKKEGKDWGYVILPVVYDGNTNEIDNDNFNEIVSIVRGLAANDERIIEYFKDKSLGEGSKERSGGAELFTMISETLSESDLAEQLSIKIWEKMSRFNFIPFKEARLFVQGLNLKNSKEWNEYRNSGQRPTNIPSNPPPIYKDDWISWGDWLGTFNISDKYRKFRNFEEARALARSLNLKTWKDWQRFTKQDNFPKDLPTKPHITPFYKNQWISKEDWLGVKLEKRGIKYRSFDDARTFARKLNLKSRTEWVKFCQSGKKPEDIPTGVRVIYKNKGFVSMGDFLGSGRVADQKKGAIFLEFKEAKSFVHKLKLKNQREWKEYKASGEKPEFIPSNPYSCTKYKDKWISWSDWLGNGNSRDFSDFKTARAYVRKLNLSSGKDWREYVLSGRKPNFIPKAPHLHYKNKGWINIGDWLGTYNKRGGQKRDWVTFDEARNYFLKQSVRSYAEFLNFKKENIIPKNIPRRPDLAYKDNWISWSHFLGQEIG